MSKPTVKGQRLTSELETCEIMDQDKKEIAYGMNPTIIESRLLNDIDVF